MNLVHLAGDGHALVVVFILEMEVVMEVETRLVVEMEMVIFKESF
jgi:hypothetical protein